MFTVPRNLSIEPRNYVCIIQIRNLRYNFVSPRKGQDGSKHTPLSVRGKSRTYF